MRGKVFKIDKDLGRTLGVAIAAALLALAGGLAAGRFLFPLPAPPAPAREATFTPPPDAAIPGDKLGLQIRRGREIFVDTRKAVPKLTGNGLDCADCHLDAGRRALAAPLWGAFGLFPQFRAKNGHVNTFAERVRECFLYSLNGNAPAYDDPDLVAIESYAAFLARGAPVGVALPGHGMSVLARPAQAPDRARGQAVFAAQCARCHGVDGAGQAGGAVAPPLWGERSYNWGAGMGEVNKAAGFIRTNMPQDSPGALTDQQAWDVATFIDGKPRPQDPRFTGSVAETRKRFHDSSYSLYGTMVDGAVLGEATPGRPAASPAPPQPAPHAHGAAKAG